MGDETEPGHEGELAEPPLPPAEAELLAQIGHDRDPDALIQLYLSARQDFIDGNTRRAHQRLDHLVTLGPSPELAALATRLIDRIKPDPVALVVLAVCAVGLVLIWFFAVRAH